LINANGKAFFDAIGEQLRLSAEALGEELKGSASADYPVRFESHPQPPTYSVSKEDFPAALAKLQLNLPGLLIHFELRSAAQKGGKQNAIVGDWKFDVDVHGNLVIIVPLTDKKAEPKRLSDPKEISDGIMTQIFTV
jgi:hypothetical protein